MKNQIELLEHTFTDGYLTLEFSINNEEEYRIFEICEDLFSEFLESRGRLEMSSDEWNYESESHYTKDWTISIEEYITNHLETIDLEEFILDYFSDKDYPELIKDY
jgi:hypothetical protein|tara:strand:+ start:4006 stop:4323 length:318 start_codon:yes stop_codon:yes gene_type:complete